MGEWTLDQSKNARRTIWGQTRGENDPTLRDFIRRAKTYPMLAAMRPEKIGPEIHCWRQIKSPDGEVYWHSCLRFKDDGWGYWTVMYRSDERRWRTTDLEDLPYSKVLPAAVDLYKSKIEHAD